MVSVDLAALRSIEREKEISFETLLDALETALLTAYKHTPHSMPHARVAIDRKTGEVVVWAQEIGPDGEVEEEYDDTPTDFGRVAAMTARQVILQRLRNAEHDQTFGEYSGREGDIVTGVVQADAQAAQRGLVLVDIGKVEAILPQAEQVPGEEYRHGSRMKAYVVGVTRGIRGPQVTVSRTHPNLVRKLFSLEVPEIADGSVEIVAVARGPATGRRSRCAPRSTGSTRRVPASGRWGSGCATSSPSCTVRRSTSSTGPRTRPPTSATPCRRRTSSRALSSTSSPNRSASWSPTSSSPWPSAGRARTPASPRASPATASTSTATPSRRPRRRANRPLRAARGRLTDGRRTVDGTRIGKGPGRCDRTAPHPDVHRVPAAGPGRRVAPRRGGGGGGSPSPFPP